MTIKTTEGDKPQNLKPASKVAASGAFIEPAIASGVDTTHPSIDANPRAGATADMNRIDLNEPSALTPQEEAVAANLKAQD